MTLSQDTLKFINTSKKLKIILGYYHQSRLRLFLSLTESMFTQLLDDLTDVTPEKIIDTVVGNSIEILLSKNASTPAALTRFAEGKTKLYI